MPGDQILEQDVDYYDSFNAGFVSVFGQVRPAAVADSLKAALQLRSKPAKSIVVEHTYIDRDFQAAYHIQAARAFTPSSRNTQRAHFFSEQITRKIVESNTKAAHTLLQKAYLGFSVIRPDLPQTLGRTMISPPESVLSDTCICGVQAQFRTSLMGQRLTVAACPYMSQDQHVLACATAALWMATSPLARKDDIVREYSTAEITRLGIGLDREYGPAIGSGGLTIEQMAQALFKMGYDPAETDSPSPIMLEKIASAYCDSGFAPVLVVELRPSRQFPAGGAHSMTVIGHLDDSGYWVKKADGEMVVPMRRRGSDLIVHDDQQGMYLAARLRRVQAQYPGDPIAEVVFRHPGLRSGLVLRSMIPVPSDIMVDLVDIMAGAQEWLLNAQADGLVPKRDILLRPVLIRSRDFKDGLASRRLMPRSARTFYRRLPMPLYIWLVELSFRPDSVGQPVVSPMVFGELIFDSTRPGGIVSSYPLAEHINGHIGANWISGHRVESVSRVLRDSHLYDPFQPPAVSGGD